MKWGSKMVRDGIFTQCACTEYEYAETPKHTHRHTPIRNLKFAHKQDLWINSQALVWQGNTGNFRQLPLPACQTWDWKVGLCWWFSVSFSPLFYLPESINAALQEEFWQNQCSLLNLHPNYGNQWVHWMRNRDSLYFWEIIVSRHDVTGFLPIRGNCHSLKLKWNMLSTQYFCFCPGQLSSVALFPSFLFLCSKKKKKEYVS